jgi:hypothetical protein
MACRRSKRFAAKTSPISPTSAVTAASGTTRAVAQPRAMPAKAPGTTIASTRRSKAWR